MNKKLYLTLFGFMLFVSGFVQPLIRAQKDLGGSAVDFFTTMALTKDGGRIAGGYSISDISGQKTGNSRGSFDYWIVKLDSTNKIEWDKTIGGDNIDILTALQQTNDGGYILGGYSFSNASGEKTQNNKGSADYWIVKLDSKGNIEWDKTIGGKSFDDLFALQQTTDNGYILGGFSFSNKSGDKTENSRGGTDYWVVKLDTKGNIEWDKTIGGSDDDDLSSLQQTRDGGYIVGGGSFSNISGEKTENSKGGEDFWIVKLNRKGKIQFDKTIGGSETDQLNALQQTSDGGFILGGHSFSNISGDKTENGKGGADYWVVKTISSGTVQFDKTLGGNDLDILTSLQQTKDGGYILGGRSFSNISGNKTENSRGGDDYWVVKLSDSLNKQFDKTIGGADFDECYSIKETGKNRYVAGGISFSNATGDKTSRSKGDKDYWLVDVLFKTASQISGATSENIASIKDPNVSTSTFDVYPNPVKDVLHIRSGTKAMISLMDASGKTVLAQSITGNADINTGSLQPGIYFLRNQTTNEVRKVVIEK